MVVFSYIYIYIYIYILGWHPIVSYPIVKRGHSTVILLSVIYSHNHTRSQLALPLGHLEAKSEVKNNLVLPLMFLALVSSEDDSKLKLIVIM